MERQADIPSVKSGDAGIDQGIAFLKHPNKLNKETKMGSNLINIFASLFGRTSTFEREMMAYAKAEYRNDWKYAYNYMLSHGGQGPKWGVK